MRMIRWIPVAVLLVAGAAACGQAGADDGSATHPFGTHVVDRGPIRVFVEETGVVEPERRIVVKSPISGVVLRLHAREGAAVRAGALLATVVPDLAQANTLAQLQSQVVSARIARDEADREYERARNLAASANIPEVELLQRRTAWERAENALSAAEYQLRLVERSGVEVGDTAQIARVVAPAGGVVILRGVEEGESVVGGTSAFGGGTELFTIADLSTLRVQVAVNEVDVGKVQQGDEVALTVDAFPGDTARGTVRLVPPAARQQERVRVFDVEIEVVEGAELLRPGMTANTVIRGPARDDVLRIPVEAVFLRQGGAVAFRVSGSGHESVPVTLGLSDLTHVEIVAGLAEGDTVALEDPAIAAERARTQRR